MSEPTEIVQRVTRSLACSACGAAGEANCDCGAPYMPASVRAAKAITENPNKSDRAIAAEIGVSDRTVNRARGSTATHDAVEKRVGADGRARKQPARPAGLPADDVGQTIVRASLHNFAARTAADDRLAEKLRKAQLKIIGLESEVEDLKAENARLRAELAKQGMPKPARGRPPGSKNKPKTPAPVPEVSAEVMKAKMAALDDGLDIPDSLRREPKAAAS
jgi:ribosomal protein L29